VEQEIDRNSNAGVAVAIGAEKLVRVAESGQLDRIVRVVVKKTVDPR